MSSIFDKMRFVFEGKDQGLSNLLTNIKGKSDDAEGSLQKLNRAQTQFGSKMLAVSRTTAFAAATIASSLFSSNLAAAASIDNLSRMAVGTQTTATELDLFGRTARAMGGNLAAAQSNIISFADKMRAAQVMPYGTEAQYFYYLGIRTKDASGKLRSMADIITDVSKRLQGMSQPRAIEFLNRLGLTEKGLQQAILSGPAGLKERLAVQARLNTITEKQIAISREMRNAQDQVATGFQKIQGTLLEAFGPASIRVMQAFGRTLEVVGNVPGRSTLFAAGGAAAAGGAIAGGLKGGIGGALATGSRFGAYGMAAAGAYIIGDLIIDDLQHYFKGQGSLIGDIIEQWPSVKPIVDGLGRLIDTIKEWFNLFDTDPKKAINDFDENRKKNTDQTKYNHAAYRGEQGVLDKISDFVTGDRDRREKLGPPRLKHDVAVQRLIDETFKGKHNYRKIYDAEKNIGAIPPLIPIQGSSNQDSGSKKSIILNNTINFNGGIDNPENAGKIVWESLQDEIRRTGYELNNGQVN